VFDAADESRAAETAATIPGIAAAVVDDAPLPVMIIAVGAIRCAAVGDVERDVAVAEGSVVSSACNSVIPAAVAVGAGAVVALPIEPSVPLRAMFIGPDIVISELSTRAGRGGFGGIGGALEPEVEAFELVGLATPSLRERFSMAVEVEVNGVAGAVGVATAAVIAVGLSVSLL